MVALPGVGSSAVVFEFTVPDGYRGIVKWMSNNLIGSSFSVVASEVVWRLLADGKPIRNYENIRVERGTPQLPRPVEGIRIYARQKIQMIVEHAANAGVTGEVAGSLSGIYIPLG